VPPRLPFALRLAPFALILACQSASAPAAPAGLSAADRKSIDSLHTAFSTAAVANDFAAVTAMYTEDGSLMAPNEPIATGRIAMKEALGHFPPIAEMKLITNDAHGTADLAAVRGTYMLLFAPPGQPVFADTGKFVELWRKQADGQWLIAWDIFNSDKPPMTP
jgi:ketosteroid isomerase-like protein